MADKSILQFTQATDTFDTDVLYMLRGTGAGRDRYTTKEDFLKEINSDQINTDALSVDILTEKTTDVGVAIEDVIIKDSTLFFKDERRPFPTNFELVGNSFPLTGASTIGALTALNETDVAFCDSDLETLVTYRFDGTDWAQVGNALDLGSSLQLPSLCTLTSTDVALGDGGTDTITTYRFDGTDWAQVGNSYSLTIGDSDLTALSSTDIVFYDLFNKLLTLRFDGTDWAQVGNTLSYGTSSVGPAICALTSNTIVFANDSTVTLQCLYFDGEDWTEYGEEFTTGDTAIPNITALNSTDIAYITSAEKTLKIYRFTGTTFAYIGGALLLSDTLSHMNLTTMGPASIGFFDGTVKALRKYECTYEEISVPPNVGFGTL